MIIICIVTVIVVITVLLVLWNNKNKQAKETPNNNPTVENPYTAIEKQKEFNNAPEQKLKDNWPGKVWGENFSIEYYASTDEFYIDVGSASCTKCRDDVLKWFKKQGVDPNKLKIIWVPSEPQKSTPYTNPNE